MYTTIFNSTHHFKYDNISDERKEILQNLIDYIKYKKKNRDDISLNFICTHNSRRSIFAQVWAQTMAYHFGCKNVYCYSGGTEATTVYKQVIETLNSHGFIINELREKLWAIRHDDECLPILIFSKLFDHGYNPNKKFGAIMVCDSADEACPNVNGAEIRIPIKYIDPKRYDDTEHAIKEYTNTSLEIAQEMWYVFSMV